MVQYDLHANNSYTNYIAPFYYLGGIPVDQSFHYLLMITHTLFQKRVSATFSDMGLTSGQPKVLDYLGQHNGSVQKSIADGCQIEPATMTGILNRMEEKGLIERRMKQGNRRSYYIYLTELGWQKQQEVMEQFQQQEQQVLAALSPAEQQCLRHLLQSLCTTMINVEVLQ